MIDKDGAQQAAFIRITTPDNCRHAVAPGERRVVAIEITLPGLFGLAARLAVQVWPGEVTCWTQ